MNLSRRRLLSSLTSLSVAPLAFPARAAVRHELVLDWATYNPLSLVLKDKGWVEEDLGRDGIRVRWVQSSGSNKALEFLNAGSLHFGSTAGAAALLGRINGNPIKIVYVFSKPEWTALVTRPDTGIARVEDLRGRRVAATKGTDPFIFLLRALDRHGLAAKDVQLVLLQHDQGRAALERGDVDAWAGLDPMMAQAELESGARLFYRDPDANSWGVLNAPEELVAERPDLVARIVALYERARRYAREHPAELRALLARAARISEAVAARQLERTSLSDPRVGEAQFASIAAAGKALRAAGIGRAEIDVEAETRALLEPRFTNALPLG
ncbi:MAG: aliphatic sulfonate ABC transporter substrate-binding protein [Geminicoccaceae bacterium]|nr:aliphatic sulfonate ABC transporter substrate-binding protein [Geminicoccaceae bacterium]MDW8341080.1 aliphatic sulfonate ABC transporter substrate-binding protein [Geminicoccaceae bacterium]